MVEGWVMDAWRSAKHINLWIKTATSDKVVKIPYSVSFCVTDCVAGRQALKQMSLSYQNTTGKTLHGQTVDILDVPVPSLDQYERLVRGVEKLTLHRVPLFNADVAPEQRFLFEHHIPPGTWAEISENIVPKDKPVPSLSQLYIHVEATSDPRSASAMVSRIVVGEEKLQGSESQQLTRLKELLVQNNPDVIIMDEAFAYVPLLDRRARKHNISLPFHRFEDQEIRYRGGSSFYSYGLVTFKDFGVRLRGRFLVDTKTAVGGQCDAEAIFALCKLSCGQFQPIASRSAGSVFQVSLVKQLVQERVLVPHKQKPIPKPITLIQLVEQDRAGLMLDAQIGLHEDVAEIDFISMFPFLMHQKNISPEKIGSGEKAPDVDVLVSQEEKGYIARALKPFIDLRLEYKKTPTALNKKRSAGLKAVLVSANGYLRFREFKLGLSTTHVALCSWVRDAFLRAKAIAESHGFEVVHGLVDSLYIKKPGITEEEVFRVIKDIEAATHIPMSFEGIFSWVMFLPSIQDLHRPVATRYYGAFKSGGFKVRGIEARQRGQPLFLREFQEGVISYISEFSAKQIVDVLPRVFAAARTLLLKLHTVEAKKVAQKIRITKERYDRNIVQHVVLEKLRNRGVRVRPGQSIQFIMAPSGPILVDEFCGEIDTSYYRKLLVRALFGMFQPLGISRHKIDSQLQRYMQTTLDTGLEQTEMLSSLLSAQ